MTRSVEDLLRALLSGDLDAPEIKRALFDRFAPPRKQAHKAIIETYLDELVADIEAGAVSVEMAAEGLEEGIDASFALSKSTFD